MFPRSILACVPSTVRRRAFSAACAFTGGSNPAHYTPEHEAFRQSVRSFVEGEIEPHIDAWEADEAFPRELYAKAGEVGLLGLGFPEELGGVPGDPFLNYVAHAELCRSGSGGLCAGLMSHTIALPPVVKMGSAEQHERIARPVLAGEKVMALGVTEPGGGSDVANLSCRAERDGDHYVLNGEKVFITSGVRADYITAAVRTGDAGSSAGGISVLVVQGGGPDGAFAVGSAEEQAAGLTRTKLSKMGWACSDTAALHFDNYRVPVANLLGEENRGFRGIMANFNNERFMLAVWAVEMAAVATNEALEWARERHTFGTPLLQHQVVRHRLVDMHMRICATRSTAESLGARLQAGENSKQLVSELCMLKVQATDTAEYCAGHAVQILGGAGYMKGSKSERIFRETKVLAIGGGASEIMKDLATRQLGW
jgi:acyl-CoA dehydrogenase